MLYTIFYYPAKLAFFIWCRHLRINKKEFLNAEGPLLIASNHPNSFLDAILLCCIFKRPIYALARGDVFTNKFYNKVLRSLNMLPIYRLSEGAENLESNYKTFDDCITVFKKKGIVLIFSEGKCINEWNLRPLKKGTARLAISAWEQGISLKIIPLGINYSSFTSFGKNIILNFGEIISKENTTLDELNYGSKIQSFNSILNTQLQKLVVQIKPADPVFIKENFEVPVSLLKKIILFIPAFLSVVSHAVLYLPIKKLALKKFRKIDHFDSVVVGLLFFFYPIYLLLIAIIIHFFIAGCWRILPFFAMPFFAWCYVQVKKQF